MDSLLKKLKKNYLFIAYFVAQHNGMHNFKIIREVFDMNEKNTFTPAEETYKNVIVTEL
jgi:hypothetical protein